jgi:type I restriction enzyme S subunit
MGAGGAQPNISREKIIATVVGLPPEQEQHRIVQKVDELMALCDRLEQQTSDQLEAHETLVDTLLSTLTQSENATELADNWARLAAHFDTLFTTEQSIDKLKQTILQLAVMGRLVEQDAGDECAQELITKLSAAKTALIKDGELKKSRKLPDITDEEAGITLPSGWLLTRLGDAYDVRDGTHDSPKYETTGYPLITSKNLSSGELSFDDVKLISESDHKKIQERSRVRQGDILFAMIGSIGNPVIVNTNREFSIKNVALFKHYSDELSCPSFLKLFLENAAEDLKQQAAGGVQSFVSLGKLRSWLIPLPPLAEQHRIVQKVDELMALCDQLKKRLNQASETRCQLAEAVVASALG